MFAFGAIDLSFLQKWLEVLIHLFDHCVNSANEMMVVLKYIITSRKTQFTGNRIKSTGFVNSLLVGTVFMSL